MNLDKFIAAFFVCCFCSDVLNPIHFGAKSFEVALEWRQHLLAHSSSGKSARGLAFDRDFRKQTLGVNRGIPDTEAYQLRSRAAKKQNEGEGPNMAASPSPGNSSQFVRPIVWPLLNLRNQGFTVLSRELKRL